jgi:hypothetical protein
LNKNEEQREEFAIHKSDIVYLVAMAWANSFACVDSNRNAIADRGWSPLNYNCLNCHPEILLSTKGVNNDDTNAAEQNGTQSDKALLVLSLILLLKQEFEMMQEMESILRRIDWNEFKIILKQLIPTRRDTLQDCTWRPAGRFILGPEVLQIFRERKLRQEQIQESEKRKQDFKTLQEKGAAIRELGKPDNELNVTQLWTMVSGTNNRVINQPQ